MSSTLEESVLVFNCPAKRKILGIFGRRCDYTNSRCLEYGTKHVIECSIFMKHNPEYKEHIATVEVDEHETYMGIGAADINLAERVYNG